MIKHDIYYSHSATEFEIQSDLYQLLKKRGYNVKGEVKAHKSRLDIVIYSRTTNKPILIIEVKARKKIRTTVRKFKQIERYKELFHLPVIMCLNASQIDQTLENVKELIECLA